MTIIRRSLLIIFFLMAALTISTTVMADDTEISADFDGNGRNDVLWRDLSTGNAFIWLLGEKGVISSNAILFDSDYVVRPISDLNGDNNDDLILRNVNNSLIYICLMNGDNILAEGFLDDFDFSAEVMTRIDDFNWDSDYYVLGKDEITGNISLFLEDSSQSPTIPLWLLCENATQMIVTEDKDALSGESWENYTQNKWFSLSSGVGEKIIYAKFRNSAGDLLESIPVTISVSNTNPEATINGVLGWLKASQDSSSLEQCLISSMEDNLAQTFNNSLAAMCFVLKDEKERAERILDFYSNATVVSNTDLTLQNFFYNGEARGFYQSVTLTDAWAGFDPYHAVNFQNDRWIGDMAWLLIAYKYYEKKYNDTEKYKNVADLIKNLLLSFYIDSGAGGYIQHGWRRGDTQLHESYGHHEGNIDCYAALKLCTDDPYAQDIAQKIKIWLDEELTQPGDLIIPNLPIDLYTWRALAFGGDYGQLLAYPEDSSNGYKKSVMFNGKEVTGFFSGASSVDNIWVDGTGHMACAFAAIGEKEKSRFYANQLDKVLINRTIDGKDFKALPYTVNIEGGYDWVDPAKGFSSCAVWYIFAKSNFNPLTLENLDEE